MNKPKDSTLSRQERAYSLLSDIANPQDYSCRVLVYSRGHSQMYVTAESTTSAPDKPVVLVFDAVRYFEGPMGWQGLDFRLGSVSERINLLQGGWLKVGGWLEKVAEEQFLFVLERPKYRVQILCGGFYIDTTEPEFRLIYSDLPEGDRE